MSKLKEIYARDLIKILDTVIENKIIFESYKEINNLSDVELKLNIKDKFIFKSFDRNKLKDTYFYNEFEKEFNFLLTEKKEQEELTDKINEVKEILKNEFKEYLFKEVIYSRLLRELLKGD